MSDAHIVQVPKAVFFLKIAQIVLSVIILGLSAYVVYRDSLVDATTIIGVGSSFALWTCVYTIIGVIYYLVSVTAAKALYNWIAVLVLECFAVLWWLCTWATLASYFVAWKSVFCYNYGCDAIDKTAQADPAFGAYVGGWEASIVLGVVQFVLFCVTLGFIGAGIHRHRKAGKPISANGSHASDNTWTFAYKNESHNMPEIQAYPAAPGQNAQSSYPPQPEYVQPKVVPVNVSYNEVPSPASAYSQPATLNQHGVYGGTRYA